MADRIPLRSAPRDRRTPLARGALGFLLLLAGCAKTPESLEIKDSWEPVNRPVFTVNREVDDYALGPVARVRNARGPIARDSIAGGSTARGPIAPGPRAPESMERGPRPEA